MGEGSDPQPPADPSLTPSRLSRSRRRARVVLGVVLGVALLLAGLDWATSSASFCGSCHEMAPRAHLWRESAHATIPCARCHEKPNAWYAIPQRIAARSGRIGRDVYKHVTGDYKTPVDARPTGVAPMQDAVCLQCHDPNRKATSGFRILIDHPKHARQNKSCISCHIRTAHPVETRGKALSLMAQCFTCHGNAKYPKATSACGACHPSGYALIPGTHKASKWRRAHGRVSEADRRLCAMCHAQTFCSGCHGLAMPHPKDWAQGKKGHSAVAQLNRAVCTQCHGNRPDMCTMCHHKAYDPTQGTWVKQHFVEAENRGASFCFRCHGPVFCVRCHIGGGQN